MERYESNVEGLLRKLPPNYPVGSVFVNGAKAYVDRFSNYCDGLAYFIKDCHVCVFDADRINGICFAHPYAPAGDAADLEEEEEA
ncbi:hypothetical protein LCM00_20365 [Bacillus infantis]|uniref:hypothetical protein n=1 Tax=Bacillus infantis TaxID=324767 RepID=UPI001CD5AAC7|nr:hypothetical protein [Bacillus infantis]MCA1041853.1 hypothetical protein [Bacillus infantis]